MRNIIVGKVRDVKNQLLEERGQTSLQLREQIYLEIKGHNG